MSMYRQFSDDISPSSRNPLSLQKSLSHPQRMTSVELDKSPNQNEEPEKGGLPAMRISHFSKPPPIFNINDFQQFERSILIEKFKAFTSWVQAEKNFQEPHIEKEQKMKDFYASVKNYDFYKYRSIQCQQESGVTCLAIDLDGKRLAVGCDDDSIAIWDLSDCKNPQSLHKSTLVGIKPSCMLFTKDFLFVGSYNKDQEAIAWITKWEFHEGLVHKGGYKDTHQGSIRGLAATEAYLLSVGEVKKQLVFWKLNQNDQNVPEKPAAKIHDGPVVGVALIENNQIIVTSGVFDMKVKLWNFSNQDNPIHVLEGHTEIIRAMAILPGGNKLATGGADKLVKVWDLKEVKEYHSFEGHTDAVRSLCFSKDGILLVSGSEDRTIRIWSLQKKKFLSIREGHQNSVRTILINNSGHEIYTGSADKTVMVWTLDHDTERDISFDEKRNKIQVISTLSNPPLAITGSSDGYLTVWDTKHAKEKSNHFHPEKKPIMALATYCDGEEVVFASADSSGKVVLWSWNEEVCKPIVDYKIHSSSITCLQFSREGQIVISGSLDKTVKFYWRTSRLMEKDKRVIDIGEPVTCLDYDHEEKWMVFGTTKGSIKVLQISHDFRTPISNIEGHKGKVTGVKITPDGILVISGSLDATIRIWNREKNSLVYTIRDLKEVLCLELSFDASKIISGNKDCTLRLWEIDHFIQIGIVHFEDEVNAVSAPKDGSKVISTGGIQSSLKMTEFNKCRTMHLFEVDKKKIRAIAISPDEQLMACASKDPKIRLWDLKTNEIIFIFEGHAQEVNSVKFTPDGKRLVSCGGDNTIRMWDLDEKKQIKMLRKNTKAVMNMALYGDANFGVFPLKYESVLICDLQKNNIEIEILQKIEQKNGPVNCVIMNAGETYSFFGSRGIIEIYETENWEMHDAFAAHNGPITALVLQEAEQRLISASSDCLIKVWSIEDLEPKLLVTMTSHTMEIRDLAMNYLGTKLYSAAADKSIFIWDLKNFKKIANLEGSTGAVNTLCLLSKGVKLFSGCTDGYIRMWNLMDARKFPFLEGHSAPITRIALTPDGNKLLSVGKDSYVIIWDLIDFKQKAVLRGHKHMFLTGLIISSNGKNAYTSSYEDDEILVWDIENEVLVDVIKNNSPSFTMILTQDDMNLVVGCCDSYIRVFNVRTKKITIVFEGHYGNLRTLAMTKDGKTLVSGGDDKMIKIWSFEQKDDVDNERKIFPQHKNLEGHSDSVMTLALTSDDRKLYSGGLDKVVIIWDLSTAKILNKIEGEIANPVRTIQLTPNNDRIIVGCLSKEKPGNYLYVFQANNLKKTICQDSKESGNPGCYKILLTKDGESFIASCSNNEISFWSLKNYQKTKKLKGFSRKITAEIMTNDKETLVFATDDRSINVWDLAKIKPFAFIDSLHSHQDTITCLAVFPRKKNQDGEKEEVLRVVSGSKDKTIMVWLVTSSGSKKFLSFALQGHTGPVNSILLYIASEEFVVSSSNDQTIRTWKISDLDGRQWNSISTNPSNVTDMVLFKNGTILTGDNNKNLIVWNLKEKNPVKKCIAILNSPIRRVFLSPDEGILIVYLESQIMQIWECKNPIKLCPIKELPLKGQNFRTLPAFLSDKNNRLMLYFENLIDCFTGEIIFRFEPNEVMNSFFYDHRKNRIFYTNSGFELHQYSKVWFSTFLYNYLNYDSLTTLKMNPDVICSGPGSTFPFFLSFLHLIAIYDKSDFFNIDIMEEMHGGKVRLTNFYNVDIFLNTPLDILMMKKNTSLIIKYFTMMFQFFKKKTTTFYEKTRFLSYKFKADYSSLHLISELIMLSTLDTTRNLSYLSTLLDNAFIPFDPCIYDNSLVFAELVDPVIIESDSLYNNDSDFINDKLHEKLKGLKLSENKSIVKAKIICIPGLCDIFNPLTDKIYSELADIDPDNEIFSNDALSILTHYIWDNQIKFYYKIELCIFVTFFLLFNINFIQLYPIRANMLHNADEDYNMATMIIDSILFCYGIFCLINEGMQMFDSGISSYFKSIWNYVDIFLIPLLLSSSFLDISLIYFDYGHLHNLTKLVFALTMFCFWFRFISYFRAIKETSSMIRLIFNVISAVKYFVLFMLLFMVTLTTTLYCLHNDHPGKNPRLFETFFVFYSSTVGDASGIEDYNSAYPVLNDYFMIFATLWFSIILLNLLVSIISDKHGDIKDAEEKTRLYELINILVDTNCSLTTVISKLVFKPKRADEYIIYLFNEKHEVKNSNQFELMEKKIEEKMKEIHLKTQNLIGEKTEFMERVLQGEVENLKVYIKAKLEGTSPLLPYRKNSKAVNVASKVINLNKVI